MSNAQLELGLNGLDYGDLDIPQLMQEVRRWNLKWLELYSDVNLLGADVGRVRDEAERAGIRIVAVSSKAKLNTSEDGEELESTVALVRRCLAEARALGAPFSVMMYGGNERRTYREALARFKRNLQPLLEEASRLGITLLVENVFSRVPTDITATIEGTLELFESIGPDAPFGLNLDHCNYMIAGEEVFPGAWIALRPYVRYMHLKDAVRYSPARYPGLVVDRPMTDHVRGMYAAVAIGQGAMNWDGLASALVRDGVSGVAAIETFVGPTQRDACIRDGLAYLAARGLGPAATLAGAAVSA
jgi:sugar phosphate isomerase/epimerase